MTRLYFTENKGLKSGVNGFGFMKFIYAMYVYLIRALVVNPIFNLVDFIKHYKNLKPAMKKLNTFKKACKKISKIDDFVVYLQKYSTKNYKYLSDYFRGIGDYTPYKRIFFMKNLKDDCDGYAYFVYWAIKWFLVGKESIKPTVIKEATVYQILNKPQRSLNEFNYNHYILYLITLDNDHFVFTSGAVYQMTLSDYMTSHYGTKGGYTKAYNKKFPKKPIKKFISMLTPEAVI